MEGKRIGAKVKQARVDAGLSQKQLAEKMGVSVMTVSRMERGAVKDVTLGMLRRVGEALGVPWRDLL